MLVCIVTLIHSCAMDFSCSSQITNNSTELINITIAYDKGRLDSLYNNNKSSYLIYLKNLNDESGVLYNLDTAALVSNYRLPINQSLRIDHNVGGRGVVPDHSMINCRFRSMLTPHSVSC
jgi:hypothetical protein